MEIVDVDPTGIHHLFDRGPETAFTRSDIFSMLRPASYDGFALRFTTYENIFGIRATTYAIYGQHHMAHDERTENSGLTVIIGMVFCFICAKDTPCT